MPLADEAVDVVFGMAILHHLKLDLVRGEVLRVLRRGGRAIFQEPMRNSAFVRGVRKMIPYTAPDVSPFEHPLTDAELREFACGFASYKAKAFTLPTTNLARLLPVARNHIHAFHEMDARVLERFEFLAHYATVSVVELTK